MKDLKKFVTVLLIAYAIVLTVNITANYNYYKAGNDWKFSVCFSLIVTTIGWAGYIILYELLFKRFINWQKRPNTSLLFAVLIAGAYGVGLMLFIMKCMVWLLHYNDQSRYDYINNAIYSGLFSMLIGLIVTGQEFLKQWKKSTEDNERMKAEVIRTQFEALKNQVNPHFLFNALNTLTAIIPENPDHAVNFVQQLSKVFRYSLQHGQDNTVAISEELKIVNAYIFLNQVRFEDKLQAEVNISADLMDHYVVTHSLLMLVENAIKHNEISNQNPLYLSVTNDGDWLIVKNSLQLKTIAEPSTSIGLENIRNRYRLISNKQLIVQKDQDFFIVKIPILDL